MQGPRVHKLPNGFLYVVGCVKVPNFTAKKTPSFYTLVRRRCIGAIAEDRSSKTSTSDCSENKVASFWRN